MLDSYGKCGKAKDPTGALKEAKESRPMESEHSVVEINTVHLPFIEK